jgi:hypothetical protein
LSPWCPLNRRLGGPQTCSGLPAALLEIKPSCPAHSLVTILTELMWLMKKIIMMFRKFSFPTHLQYSPDTDSIVKYKPRYFLYKKYMAMK